MWQYLFLLNELLFRCSFCWIFSPYTAWIRKKKALQNLLFMVFNSSKPIICISITLITYQFLDVTLCPTHFFKVYNIKILLVFRMTSFPFGLIYKNYLYFLPSWLLTRTGFPLLRITYSISCYYLLLRAAC